MILLEDSEDGAGMSIGTVCLERAVRLEREMKVKAGAVILGLFTHGFDAPLGSPDSFF